MLKLRSRSSAIALAAIMLASGAIFAPTASAEHIVPPPSCFEQVDVDVLIVMDISGSMLDENKIQAAKDASEALLDNLGPDDQSGLVAFSTGVAMPRNLNPLHVGPFPSTDWHVDQQTAGGFTAIWKGMRMARFELINQPHIDPAPYSHASRIGVPGTKQAIVLLSDGEQTIGGGDPVTEANLARSAGIEIFAVGLGTAIPPPAQVVLQQIASSGSHYFVSPDPADLPDIFRRISFLLRDVAAPSIDIVRPDFPARLYRNDAVLGASPFPLPTAANSLSPHAVAGDDCYLEDVEFFVDEYAAGGLAATIPLGAVHAPAARLQDDGSTRAVFAPAPYVCGARVGPHVFRVVATDWLGRTATDSATFQCIVEHVTSDATSVYSRTTNPDDPTVVALGAHLGGGLGSQTRWILNFSTMTPTEIEVSNGYDTVSGRQDLVDWARNASARSRLERVVVGALPLDVSVLETRACASVNTDPARPDLGVAFRPATCYGHEKWRVDREPLGRGAVRAVLDTFGATASTLLPGACQTGTLTPTPGSPTVERCWEHRIVVPEPPPVGTTICVGCPQRESGIEILVNERIRVTSAAASEITVNGLHVLAQRPAARSELIISQSYAGASLLGASALMGPWRALDFERDAGVPGDASDAIAAPMPLAPGVYGARLARPGDWDAYGTTVQLGEKVHAFVQPSNKQTVRVGALPATPSVDPTPLTDLRVELYDPTLRLRDSKVALATGVGTQVELNVDVPGTWVVVVRPFNDSQVTDYTMALTVGPAPRTDDNDALTLQEAGATCLDGVFIGPGVHIGTIEDKDADASDWYRFRLFEGQSLALLLRPGDTIDSAMMRLRFFDPACREIGGVGVAAIPGGFKGSPSLLLYDVPVGGDGIYRAVVEYDEGIGTYELVLATTETAVWGRV